MAIDDLHKIYRTYKEFAHVWRIIRDSILESIKGSGIASYCILEGGETDSEVRFLFCGVRCYVRFTHDLQRGSAEYGVLVSGCTQGCLQRKAIQQVDLADFDKDSNRLIEDNARIMHDTTLANLFPQMLAAFFEAPGMSSRS